MGQQYERLCVWDEKSQIYLVQETGTNLLAVQRHVPKDKLPVYQEIQKIKSPFLSQIYNIYVEDEEIIVTEEFLNGKTLEMLLEEKENLEESQVISYIIKICKGVTRLHEHGILHKDLTLTNVMVTFDGKIKVFDYDIAAFISDEKGMGKKILGTKGYTSPERFGYKAAGYGTDVYSIGVLLNLLLTGVEPKEKLYDSSGRIIQKAVFPDTKKRYQSAERLRADLCQETPGDVTGFERILRTIPGFRTATLWKMVLAAIGYFLFFSADLLGAVINFFAITSSIWKVLFGQFGMIVLPFLCYTNGFQGTHWNWGKGYLSGKMQNRLCWILCLLIQWSTFWIIVQQFGIWRMKG